MASPYGTSDLDLLLLFAGFFEAAEPATASPVSALDVLPLPFVAAAVEEVAAEVEEVVRGSGFWKISSSPICDCVSVRNHPHFITNLVCRTT